MYRADLHIHSRFSRATSKKLTLRNLAAWASLKGIHVLATGDFTHPQWREELKNGLILNEESALYSLREPLTPEEVEKETGHSVEHVYAPQFILQAEISSIYKRHGKVRKVHNLIFAPSIEEAENLSKKLEQIGNLHSDGRPILGLDCQHLLDMVLHQQDSYLVPAHIWTPWFSLFGSKSGFDSLEECFGDLWKEVFAVETGLSSDPDMNRCWSHLDHLSLISNSDAHGGENLAREVNLFDGDASYKNIFSALKKQSNDFRGTIEFFPEEGKYHLDGHRNCNLVFEPSQSLAENNICPVCQKPLTIGVLHRVLSLADRKAPPKPKHAYSSLVPLAEILGELLSCGAKTKKVRASWGALIRHFGSELDLLTVVDVPQIRSYWNELGEAISRMRSGNVICHGGYDGEFGVIHLFEKGELSGSKTRIDFAEEQKRMTQHAIKNPHSVKKSQKKNKSFRPSPAQKTAQEVDSRPCLVLAGPGAGKTSTLIGRIEYLLNSGINSDEIATVTFTRRASLELHSRLADLDMPAPVTNTLHALALDHCPYEKKPRVLSEQEARAAFATVHNTWDSPRLKEEWLALSQSRECMDAQYVDSDYANFKKARNYVDYSGLLEIWLRALQNGAPKPWKYLLVDEVQDLSPLEISLIQHLLPANGEGLFAIGDPDQSIYNFRLGGQEQPTLADKLKRIWSELNLLSLDNSYRCPAPILNFAGATLGNTAQSPKLISTLKHKTILRFTHAPNAQQEAKQMAQSIAWLLGDSTHQELHALKRKEKELAPFTYACLAPSDIAVLVRIKTLMSPLKKALEERGIPCACPEVEAFFHDKMVQEIICLHEQYPNASLQELRVLLQIDSDIVHKSSAYARFCNEFVRCGSWDILLKEISLLHDIDCVRAQAEHVQIMTMHAAKGLEFKAVFIPALEEGFMPFSGIDPLITENNESSESNSDVHKYTEDEKRLLYVALTRAEQGLFLSCAQERTLYGKTLKLKPSSFLNLSLLDEKFIVRKTNTNWSQLNLLG